MKYLCFFLSCFLYLVTPTTTAPTVTKATTTTTLPIKTPRDLEDIFKARCMEYTTVVEQQQFENSPKNCTALWSLFRKAFADKPECSIKPEDYKDFIDAVDHYTNTTDRLLLWNGKVYPFVIDFSRQTKKYITIRDQLAVYIMKNIEHWCGQSESPGINYNKCPKWEACDNHPVSAFWKQMSRNFVKKARGTIYVMFNASSKIVFNTESIFAKSELANLNKEHTQVLHAILVSNIHGKPTENCKQGSMRALRRIVEKKGMRFRCWDHNKQVRHLQCVHSPHGCSGASLLRYNIFATVSLACVGMMALRI